MSFRTTLPGRSALALGIAVALAASLSGCFGVGASRGDSAETTAASPADRELQNSLDGLVDLGFPAALGTRTGDDGSRVALASGVADLESGRPAQPDEMVRLASNTKMFTAVVVMQLVDEGRIALDEPVEAHLPGLVRGDGIDGSLISVRQLLQHTSGLPEYTGDVLADDRGFRRYTPPRDLLDLALAHPAVFTPGDRWEYSNTNYLLLGMLIERVTGEPLELEIGERIIDRLGLESTVFPRGGDRAIPNAHPLGYHVDAGSREFADWTELDPSPSWAAGGIVSTPGDLNIFMQALFDGELTSTASLAQMKTTVPADEELWPGSAYGLGVQSYPLSCGGVAWGHGGDIPGYQTRNAVDEDGQAVTVAVTALPWAFIDPADEPALLDGYRAVTTALDDALCAAN